MTTRMNQLVLDETPQVTLCDRNRQTDTATDRQTDKTERQDRQRYTEREKLEV